MNYGDLAAFPGMGLLDFVAGLDVSDPENS